jgi:hypothetical protein
MNRLLASAATLASLAAIAIVAPAQASAAPVPAPADSPCVRVNHRVVSETNIDLFACYDLPGAYGRVGYIAQISNAWAHEIVIIRYRSTGGELGRNTAPSTGSYAATPYFWGGSPTELQACAYTAYNGFNCAWTANDVG